jgi:ABC-type phosphate transport system substrate-binding protein
MQLIRLKLRAVSEEGFLVTLTCDLQGRLAPRDRASTALRDRLEVDGFLPNLSLELREAFQQWQINYRQLDAIRQCFIIPKKDNSSFRLTPKSATIFSRIEAVDRLKKELNNWLNSYHSEWQKIREALIALADRLHQEHSSDIQLILDTTEANLCRLPWQEWDLLTQYYPHTEIALVTANNTAATVNTVSRDSIDSNTNKIRILAVFGNDYNLNTNSDLEIIDRLKQKNAEVVFLDRPSLKDLCQTLWDDRGYHIFIFIGHSSSREDGKIGWIQVNENESLTIESFKNALKQAINKGLQLAIFNSCDGLGLASQLAELNLPQSIVMREPIPDEVAIEFLAYFFQAFTTNNSLFTSLHIAKKRLEPFQTKYPGSTWLPILCLQPSTKVLNWQEITNNNYTSIEPKKLTRSTSKFATVILGILFSFIIGISSQYFTPSLARIILPNNHSSLSSIQNLPQGTWQYGGSTTWQPIRNSIDQKINQKYSKFQLIYTEHPILPSGSGTGIKMLLDGQISFVQSSRSIVDNEYKIARQRGLILKQIPIAIDSLAVAVSPSLKIKGLTIKQLKNIYNGRLTNWQQLGGEDIPIIPYARSLESGTTEFFQQNILGNQSFSDRVIFVDNKNQIFENLNQPEYRGGIYFASATEIVSNCQLKSLPISRRSTNLFISPYRGELNPPEKCQKQPNRLNLEAIENGDYPLTRRLFIITSANNYIEVKIGESYANLLLTDEGQELIKKAGFIPLKSF